MRLLALSGSLRAASTNTALLRAAAAIVPAIRVYDLGDLPLFNPDLDEAGAPPPVQRFRAALVEADGVLIACPEYAHGVPGAFKNALDWVVGSGEFVDKPTALIHASPRSAISQAALIEILVTMSARLVPEASVTVPLMGKGPAETAEILTAPATRELLAGALRRLGDAIVVAGG